MVTAGTTATDSTDGTILIVDDERAITSMYAQWLDGDYEVRTANDGAAALDDLDESVDVVLLDRRMPGMPGAELLATIRERNLDCRVAIVSAVEPDVDIVDMGFDTYLEKPVSDRTELREAVSKLLDRSTYESQLQELLSLASKKASLEANAHGDELAANEEYRSLIDRMDSLRDELSVTATTLGDDDIRAEFSNH